MSNIELSESLNLKLSTKPKIIKKKYIAPDTVLINVEIERIVATSKYDEIVVNPNENSIPV